MKQSRINREEYQDRKKNRPTKGDLCKIVPKKSCFDREVLLWPSRDGDEGPVLVVQSRARNVPYGRKYCVVMHPIFGIINIEREYLEIID